MSFLKNKLHILFLETFQKLGLDPSYAILSASARPDLADYQCNGAMALAKIEKTSPLVLAEKIKEELQKHPSFSEFCEDVTIAPPGFINIRLSLKGISTFLRPWAQDIRQSFYHIPHPQKVVFDFGGPNLAKEMHVGHLRSAIIGDCLQRLFRFVGHEVISDVHLGDWGTPMGMLLCELKRKEPHLPYFKESYGGPYPMDPPLTIEELSALYRQASERCKDNPEAQEEARQAAFDLQNGSHPGYRALWSHFRALSVGSVAKDFENLGIHFDLWLGESDAHETLVSLEKRLKDQKILVQSEGAWIIPLEREDDKKPMPPLIVVNSDGGYSYGATDLATLEDRAHDLGAATILYVVDKRQSLHFEQVFRSARLASVVPSSCHLEHLPFGTMNGPDGKPFKTREGGVMRLQDLIGNAINQAMALLPDPDDSLVQETDLPLLARQIAISAIKYNDLKNSRTSDYIFDLKNFMTFEGRTGPYLQYAVARINSLLRKAEAARLSPGILTLSHPAERRLGLLLCQFPEAIEKTVEKKDPSLLAEYVFNVAQDFSSFYTDCPIMGEANQEVQQSRLQLVHLCREILKKSLYLLGIETPEVMVKRR